MNHSLEDLHRFGLKLFVEPGISLEHRDVIPVFHRWIQTAALDRLLIDVADYTHLVDGPSVLLVGDEGNLSLDTTEHRLGILCTLKRPRVGTFEERLSGLARTLVTACHLLESDPVFGGRLRFSSNEMLFVSNDRLIAAPGDDSVAALTPAVRSLMESLYPGKTCDMTASSSKTARLSITISVREPLPLATLLERASETTSNK